MLKTKNQLEEMETIFDELLQMIRKITSLTQVEPKLVELIRVLSKFLFDVNI
jgi:hypothetical protein